MSKPTLVFCGSFQAYSSLVLAGLLESQDFAIMAVVTTPPAEGIANPVQKLAEAHHLPVFTPTTVDDQSLTDLESLAGGKPDILLTAGYGHLLPTSWLSWPTQAALNLHFSLLPSYRGANPAEWALLAGETETGITLIEMSPEFDTGKIVAQAAIQIEATDTRETVYQKLYDLGGRQLTPMLNNYLQNRSSQPQPESSTPYAKRFKREDGFIAWQAIKAAMNGQTSEPTLASQQLQKVLTWLKTPLSPIFIERAARALAGFPSLWTMVPTAKGEQRLKILTSHLENGKLVLDQVQIAGKNPTRWAESKNVVLN